VKLGLVADAHGHVDALAYALDALNGEVDGILFAGDAMNGYRFSDEIVDLIRAGGHRFIRGNHERTLLETRRRPGTTLTGSDENWAFIEHAGERAELEVDGRRLLMVHGSPWPPYDEYLFPNHPLLARVPELEVDFLVYGHTHVPFSARFGETLVINPGSVGEARGNNGGALSFAMLDTATDDVHFERFVRPRLVSSTRE
jgi:putative phosphoesterase